MHAIRNNKIEFLYKVTCKDALFLVNQNYSKRLGSNIVTSKDIYLTKLQINYLATICTSCNKTIIGYLRKKKKFNFLYTFIDLATFYEEYKIITSRG